MQTALVVFDLFGTLLDIASLRTEVAAVCSDPSSFVSTWRDKQIAYAFASTIMNRYENFDAITTYALRFTAAKYNITLDADAESNFIAAWSRVKPYPDAVAALDALAATGTPCAVLTNGTAATANAALATAGIADFIERAFFVEDAAAYKPDQRVYALVTDHYRLRPEQIVFVTSNGWDATGAAAFGHRVAWCNRSGNPRETYGPPPTWTIESLGALTPLLVG